MMNDSGKGSGLSFRDIGLIVLVALVAATAAHAVQTLLLGDASTAVSAGVATTLAVLTILGTKRRK